MSIDNTEDMSRASGASSFGEGSFMTNEPTENKTPQKIDKKETVGTDEDTAAAQASFDTGVDVTEGASSFGDGSFQTYEKSVPVDTVMKDEGHRTEEKVGKYSVASWILFLAGLPLSFISFIVMVVSIIVGGGVGAPIIGVMLIVPIASIAFGIFLKIKHGIGLKNIIGGFLCLAFMVGMFTASFSEIPSYDGYTDDDEEAILFAESVASALSMELPEGYYSTYYAEDESYNLKVAELYYDFDAYFNALETVKASENFKTNMPSTYIGILPPSERSESYDFCLVYNVADGVYNEIPKAEGTYRMICIAFYSYYGEESGYMTITEYELEYTTEFKVESGFESDF